MTWDLEASPQERKVTTALLEQVMWAEYLHAWIVGGWVNAVKAHFLLGLTEMEGLGEGEELPSDSCYSDGRS